MPGPAITELVSKRTLTAKHFDLGNGVFLGTHHTGQIHYPTGALKKGPLADIDTTLNYNASSKSYPVTSAGYEAEIGLYGDVRFINVDHSVTFALANPAKIQAHPHLDSDWGKRGKALIWKDIIQPGGHQILEARNNSLAKIFHFDSKPLSNVIQFQVIPSTGLKFSDGTADFNLANGMRSLKGKQGLFHTGDRLSYIRTPRAWNHRGQSVNVELDFSLRSGKIYVQKIIPQTFIDATFTEAGAWLQADTTTSFYAGAGDGYSQRTAAAIWSTIRAGASSATITNTSTGNYGAIDDATTSGQYAYFFRSFFPINTSNLTAGASIIAATFYGYGSAKANAAGSLNLALDKWNGTAGFEIANYSSIRQATTDVTYSGFSITAYNSWALNATGLGNINKTGTTYLAVRLAKDLDNSAPTWVSSDVTTNLTGCFSESATGPYMDVTYTVPVSGRKKPPVMQIY